MRGWFALDLFSIAPSTFDILPFVPGSGFAAGDGTTNLRVFRVIRTTRLLKLVRLVRSSRLVTRWRTRISVTFATLTIVTLSFAIMVLTHWLACILALQTIFSATPSDSWMGATGWCAPGDFGEDDVCAPPAQLYAVSLHWAFLIISGYGSDPQEGPFEKTRKLPGDGGAQYTMTEMMLNLLFLVCGALGWAYVTAQIVDIIVNANPDATAFKNRMDDLNRYVSFYELKPDVAQRLREYFYETRYTRAAEARREIVSELSTDLQEEITSLVNNKWLSTVAFFRGMTTPEGVVVAPPAERRLPREGRRRPSVDRLRADRAAAVRPAVRHLQGLGAVQGAAAIQRFLVGRLGRDAAERAARQARRRHHLPPRAVGRRPDAARDRRRLSDDAALAANLDGLQRAARVHARSAAEGERRRPREGEGVGEGAAQAGQPVAQSVEEDIGVLARRRRGAPAAAGAAKRAPRPREARSIAELHRAIDARFDAVAGAVGSLEARLDQSVARVEEIARAMPGGGAAAAAGAAAEAAASPGLFSSLFGGGAAAAPEAATAAADGDAHGGRRKSDQPRKQKRRPSLIKAAAWAAGGGAAEEAPAAEEEAPSGSASKRGGYSTKAWENDLEC